MHNICWETWNDAGYRVRTSASHDVNEDDPTRTVCGKRIPEHGNGTVHEHGSEAPKNCQKCLKIYADSADK